MIRRPLLNHLWWGAAPVAALILAAGAVSPAAPPADAVATGPVVTFIDSSTAGTRWLRTAAPDGTASVPLTPAGYRAYTFDVSADGSAYVVGLGHPDAAGSVWDRSHGLVLVRRTNGITTSTILTNYWDDAAISSDGSAVWWLADDVLWRYAAGEAEAVNRSTFAAPNGWQVDDLAVGPDDRTVAVSYSRVSGTGGRILAADSSLGTAVPYLLHQSALDPSYGQMYWGDPNTLLFAYTDGATTTWYAGMASPNGSGSVGPVGEPLASTLADVYSIRQLGGPTGQWWGWRDVGGVTEYAVVPSPADFATAAWTARVDGSTSFAYVPSTSAPPALTTPVNRPATYPNLLLSAPSVRYGKRLVYVSWADYLVALPGQTLATDADEVDRGLLQSSVNGTTWSTVGWTSWANPVVWPPDPDYYGSGYTPVLKRTTWFRWSYPGDLLTRSSMSVVRKVVVTPTITVSARRSTSGTTKVYGHVTRVGGSIRLWRWNASSWRKVATTTIGSAGRYSFGYRRLTHGTYKLVVPATVSWGTAVKRFRL